MNQHERRKLVYQSFFGKRCRGVAAASAEIPVEVLLFSPMRGKRDFYTLVTNGLSDFRMKVPKKHPFCRVELGVYLDEPNPAVAEMLQWLSRVIIGGEWVGPGSTMTNGMPPNVFIDGSELDCFGFFQPLVDRDFEIPDQMNVEGDDVCLIWVVPITSTEREFLNDHQPDEFYLMMEKAEHNLSFDSPRESYV